MRNTGKSAKRTVAVKAARKSRKPQKKAAAKRTTVVTRKRPAVPHRRTVSFGKRELEEIKLKLNEMRSSLSKNVEDKKNIDILEAEVGDSIDQATQSLDKEILFELSDNERKMLDSIEAALRKMDNGTYGACEHCKRPINKKRLKALPSARYCMSCQSGAERTRM